MGFLPQGKNKKAKTSASSGEFLAKHISPETQAMKQHAAFAQSHPPLAGALSPAHVSPPGIRQLAHPDSSSILPPQRQTGLSQLQ